jgi:hypothetical protein
MKLAYVSLIVGTCAAASLHALAATQVDATRDAATQAAVAQHAQVRTSTSTWAMPQPIALDQQVVQSHGGSLRPGPHNRQTSPAHGGPVASMARPEDMPARE